MRIVQIGDNKVDTNSYHQIISDIITILEKTAKTNPDIFTACKTGDDFELCVVDATKKALRNAGISANVHHTPGSHIFPDIIIEDEHGLKYGIEAKSSSAAKSKGWKINGNSVMGSTRDDDVIETYIVFGKIAKSVLAFRAKLYEDCIANVVVTHSPRYFIDMDIQSDDTFFVKSGIKYKEIVRSKNPIGLITKYFHDQGQSAWWLSESTPAALRLFSELKEREQNELFGYGLAHFPELFARNSTKYKRFAIWLATERSIVAPCLRDDFSAGGKVNLILNCTEYQALPQIFYRLRIYRDFLVSALEASDSETLAEDWCSGKSKNDITSKIQGWISVIARNINVDQLPKGIKPRQLLLDIMTDPDD